jgi:hypothetical protein
LRSRLRSATSTRLIADLILATVSLWKTWVGIGHIARGLMVAYMATFCKVFFEILFGHAAQIQFQGLFLGGWQQIIPVHRL